MNLRIWDESAAGYTYFCLNDILVDSDRNQTYRYVWDTQTGNKVRILEKNVERGTGHPCVHTGHEIYEGDIVFLDYFSDTDNEEIRRISQLDTFVIIFDRGAFWLEPETWSEDGTRATPRRLEQTDKKDEFGDYIWEKAKPDRVPLHRFNIAALMEMDPHQDN